MILVRKQIGDVLRDFRIQKGKTLRQVAAKASVALGYLSEVERGQKEASSEILASVADALETPISIIMQEVSDRIQVIESLQGISSGEFISAQRSVLSSEIPDTVPADLVSAVDQSLSLR